MVKKFSGVCSEHGVDVIGIIDYLYSGTTEGKEYSKGGMNCNYKDEYKCIRNNCPFWKNAQKVICY